MTLSSLPTLSRDLLSLWALLICFGAIVNVAYASRQKRFVYCHLAILVFCAPWAILYLLDGMDRIVTGDTPDPFISRFLRLPIPVTVIILSLAFLTLLTVLLLYFCVRYEWTHVTPRSLKASADEFPSGLCFYEDNGLHHLRNNRINQLSQAITGKFWTDGRRLWEQVREHPTVHLEDGTVWRFSNRLITTGKETYHELVADNVTELTRQSDQLQAETQQLKKRNERMKAYGASLDETVRREEILSARAHIHDEMNRLLLSTDQSVTASTPEERSRLLKTWQQNIMLLCMRSEPETQSNVLSDLTQLGALIGIRPVFDGAPHTNDPDTLRLFSDATEEIMSNARKHGNATVVYVSVSSVSGKFYARYTNNGISPGPDTRESGGLSHLRARIEAAGGTLRLQTRNDFSVSLMIPIGGKQNVL